MPRHATRTSFKKGHIPRNYKPKVEKICQQCGNHFFVGSYRAKLSSNRFCSNVCRNQAQVGKHHSLEARAKMSLSHRGLIHLGSFVKGHIPHNKDKPFSEEIKGHMRGPRPSIAGSNNPMYGKQRTQEVKNAISRAQVERYKDPAERQKLSERSRKLWLNREFINKVIRGRGQRPTKPEQKLIAILGRHLPEFKYNGDFNQGVILNSLIPDFVNVDGKKEVIEVFGDYFHSPNREDIKWHRTELGRIMAYNAVGYKCLILWENELETLEEDEIIGKVKTFFRRKHGQHSTSQRF